MQRHKQALVERYLPPSILDVSYVRFFLKRGLSASHHFLLFPGWIGWRARQRQITPHLRTCRTVVRLGMMERVVSCLFIVVPVGAICVVNYLIGRSWTRLDHNPWAGKFLGGTFDTPNPGWNPGALDLAKIHQRGRITMTMAPVIFLAVAGVTVIYVFTR